MILKRNSLLTGSKTKQAHKIQPGYPLHSRHLLGKHRDEKLLQGPESAIKITSI